MKNPLPTNIIPKILENQNPIVKVEQTHPRIFTQSVYYQQHIPNSLQNIYIRKEVLEKLHQAINLLPEQYSFILYDGYRPFQVQQYLFELFSEKIKSNHPEYSNDKVLEETLKFVAFPSMEPDKTSPHITGGAIDLTLGTREGIPLDMGTDFDEMSVKSATRYFEENPNENETALMNRRLLYHSLVAVGFTNYDMEWWHYDYGNVTWAKRTGCAETIFGPIESVIEQNQLKEIRFS